MDYIRLGRTGPKVSAIGMGAWQASGSQWGDDVNDELIILAIGRSLELGVNLIDTAELYGDGHSESVVGEALKRYGRDNFVVATKFHGGHLHYDDVLKACDESLKRLGISQIDVYQMHWTDPWEQVPLKETMRAMTKLYREGKIGHVAVSNFAVRDLEEARALLDGIEVVSNQVRYNMLQREIEEEVLPYCLKSGITVLAWSPLAQGVLTGKYGPGKVPSDRVRSRNKLFSEGNLRQAQKLLKVLREIAEERAKTVGQVALNWLTRSPGVVPIPGAKNPQQAEENAGAVGWRLTSGELTRIELALREVKISYF
jgi:aryl-alcohol dehydrogenase-like predicted oxidoreductase